MEEEDEEEKKTEGQTVEEEDKKENEEREVPRPAAAQELKDELWFLNVRNEIFAKAFSRIMDIAQWERSSSSPSYRSAGHLSKF